MTGSTFLASWIPTAPIGEMRIGLPLINYSDQHDARGFGPVSVRLFGKRRRVDPDEKELVDAKKKFIEAFLEAVKASK
jgi:hypothetical protein